MIAPNWDTWTYEHQPADNKITKITSADGATTTEITYAASGWAAEKVSSVKIYDAAMRTDSRRSEL